MPMPGKYGWIEEQRERERDNEQHKVKKDDVEFQFGLTLPICHKMCITNE